MNLIDKLKRKLTPDRRAEMSKMGLTPHEQADVLKLMQVIDKGTPAQRKDAETTLHSVIESAMIRDNLL